MREKKKFVVYKGKMKKSSFERKFLEIRFENKKKPKYVQVYYDAENNVYYINELVYSRFETMIKLGLFIVRDRLPLTDKQLHGSIESLMQSSIPGRGQNRKRPHNTDGMHI